MCLPVSCLFWVSSLAYPNLLGTKAYVVVVVVVVVVVCLTVCPNLHTLEKLKNNQTEYTCPINTLTKTKVLRFL
jgi:hypothetical protein